MRQIGNVAAQVNPPNNLPTITGPIYPGGERYIPDQPDDLGSYKGSGAFWQQ